jgi:NAD(P)-dependent dehydrogenase (short-subunit alcohol dehydrogenase family)
MPELQAKDCVVVTGAAQGIGRVIAQTVSRRGAHPVLWDLDEAGLQETAELCRAAGAADVNVATVDVADEAAVSSCAQALIRNGLVPFGLVSNAGIFPRAGLLEADARLWRRVLDVNLVGAFNCARAFGAGMLENRRGAIVIISSGLALQGNARGAHYAASKAGLMALSKSLALELAPHIRVNCVLPGITETAQPLGDMTLDQMNAIGRDIPLGRVGQPQDIANMVSFLLGDDAGYITGQSYSVCGGALMAP